ncbi:MAG: ribonuclease Z [Gemmatimonadales bacterium]|nr:ribonuclease Z [Gemmatimonadales bacterium]NIN12914.1 ribonuclease Z [Gemmatimonadales bacterium]NIR00201.1 ribonuclease Z [Gemmatimonadales bacterium]NIS65994.1 ribonuclease Z [Gemmatimonadales bacterium]
MLSVTFLGTSASRPTVERGVSSIAVAREGETLLFECGEGTQRQMMRYGVSFSLGEIFVTHYHADHFLGIIGLVRTLGLQGREEPLHLYGPPGAEKNLGAAVALGVERAPFAIEIHQLKPGDVLKRDEYDLEVIDVEHGRNAVGFALREHQRLGRFNPEKAREFGVPEGPLWGRLHRGEAVEIGGSADRRIVTPDEIVGPPRPGRLVVYSGDTRPCESVVAAAEGADLLVHEATFSQEEKDRAQETDHATALEAAQVALAARVKRLVLTHVSARFSAAPEVLADEAREVFAETVVARDGMTIEVPLVE